MLLDNFERTKEKIEIDLRGRMEINKNNYYNQIELIKKYNIENIIYEYDIVGMKIKYRKFYNCIFKNIKFKEYTFYGSEFKECKFENIEFNKCNFYNQGDVIPFLCNGTVFINCTFTSCNLKNVVFENITLYNSKFILSNMTDSIISMSYLESIYFKDCDCRGFKSINTVIDKIEFEDDFLTKFNEDTFIDKMDINKIDEKFYEKSYKVYKNIGMKFEHNRLLNNSGEYYYLAKCMERKFLKGMNKIKSYIFWMLCGYGERPTYALITSMEILLFFAILYMFLGLDVNGQIIKYDIYFILNLPVDSLVEDFLHSLYFSVVTFTTVGYGDVIPIGISVIMSGIEMILGVTMVGLWTATLARKIIR